MGEQQEIRDVQDDINDNSLNKSRLKAMLCPHVSRSLRSWACSPSWSASNWLCCHPHYTGTIHAMVNQFLALPRRLKVVD